MTQETLAPIVLFVYNRPWHTKQVIEALLNNSLSKNSDLYIFSDGPKNEKLVKSVMDVRNYIKTINGFKSVIILEREKNIGLGNSIITGVTDILNKRDKVIVLEDDVVVSPYFLNYMNDALNLYKDIEKVGSVNSMPYPISGKFPKSFLLRIPDSCGWATWNDRWKLFNADADFLYDEIKSRHLVKKFNIDGTYPFLQMLKWQIKGLNSSWAIRWYASLFLSGRLNLYYQKPLVNNIGWDGTGTHCQDNNIFKNTYYFGEIENLCAINPVEENKIVLKVLKKYFTTPKMFIILKMVSIRNFFRMALIDLGLKEKKK